MNGFRRNAGFTLVEMLVVIAILGILAAIAVPQYLGAREKALDSACLNLKHAMDAELVTEADYWLSHPMEPTELPGSGSPILPQDFQLSVLTSAKVAERHLEPSPANGSNGECTKWSNIGIFNPACAYNLGLSPGQMTRCQVGLIPRFFVDPSDEINVFVFHKDYHGNLELHTVSLDD